MNIVKRLKGLAVGLGVLGFLVCLAPCQTINQSGGSGTTYTDLLGDHQGSANLLRDISSVSIANDAVNLYFTLNINPAGNIATGGAFNYGIDITTGISGAGNASNNVSGNPYGRAISFDSSFGGMTDWIGVFGAGGAGSGASPYTSYGFNDYAWRTNGVSLIWSKIDTVSSGEPIGMGPGSTTNNSITITVPMSDLAWNLSLTPGSTFDFDVVSTGTSGNQTAYDSLAVQGPIQGTYNSTAQFNETVLDQYTITDVPEPATLALAGLSGLSLLMFRRQRK